MRCEKYKRGRNRIRSFFLVRAKIRLKTKRGEKTKKSEIKKWGIGKLNKTEVKEEFIKEVTADVPNTQK